MERGLFVHWLQFIILYFEKRKISYALARKGLMQGPILIFEEKIIKDHKRKELHLTKL